MPWRLLALDCNSPNGRPTVKKQNAVFAFLAVAFIANPLIAAEPQQAEFDTIADLYYDSLFNWDPNLATYAGIHDRDNRLANMSAKAFSNRIVVLEFLQTRLAILRKLS